MNATAAFYRVKAFSGNHSPVLISAVVHIGVSVLLALVAITPEGNSAATLHVTRGETGEGDVQVVQVEKVEIDIAKEALPSRVEAAVSVADAPPIEPELVEQSPSLTADLGVAELDLSTVVTTKQFAVAGTGSASGHSVGRAEGFDSGSESGHSDGAGARRHEASSSFFGAHAAGGKVVFVLDRSGSMKEMIGVRSRAQELKKEIFRSIHALEENMAFNVIFFSDDSIEIDSRGLRPATRENKLEVIRWIRGMRFEGDTFPEESLRKALDQRPDAIFFLTDGIFGSEVVMNVTEENSHQIPIFTICMGNPQGAFLLRSLASQNHGTFRFVW